MPRSSTALLLISTILLAGGCRTTPPTPPPTHAAAPPVTTAQAAAVDRYLSQEAAARCVEDFVSPYRVNGTVAQFPRAGNDIERTIVKQLIATNSPAVTAAAQADDASTEQASLWDFQHVLGPGFTPEHCASIESFINVAFKDTKRINTAVKKLFTRPRPGEADPDHPKMNPSFPSGHSSTAGLRYRLLAAITEATPERELDLCKHAWFMCYNRLSVNAHYPSDVAAGFVLGEMAADTVLKEATDHPQGEAAKALSAAKAEWKRNVQRGQKP